MSTKSNPGVKLQASSDRPQVRRGYAAQFSTNMRITKILLVWSVAGFCVAASNANTSPIPASPQTSAQQPNTLCAKDERVIFSCLIKCPAKIVSICASKDLTSERGYLQYRFGLP